LKKRWIFINIIILSVILFHSIVRDIELTKRMPCDLRNRVVGARLQRTGVSPYFYHWHPGENLRFVDPQNIIIKNGEISNITASPFFHQLLYPICEHNQKSLSWFWSVLQYVMLGLIILICYRQTNDQLKQIIVINVGVLFTLTEAWKSLISAGQLYLFCAFLIICIIAGINKRNKTGVIIAGVCMAALVLNRPVVVLVFIPLLPLFKSFRLFFITAFTGLAIYGLFVVTSPFEKYLWKDYMHAVTKHVEMHQIFDRPGPPPKYDRPNVLKLEGFDLEKIDRITLENPIKVYSESGNFFVIYYMMTNKRLPLAILNSITAGLMIGLFILFFYYYKKNNLLIIQVLLFSFSTYIILELSNPIHRFQYNTVQWFPLVLIGFILCKSWKSLSFILLTSGLILNIINTPWILIRHTIGEYCWMIALLIISISPIQKIQWKQP
jgi:Glycosyltransferase family 87